MPIYNNIITDFIAGDDFTIERTIGAIPSGQILTQLWFTIKSKIEHTDAQAILQKILTSDFDPDVGYIDDVGSDGTGHAYIYLSPTDTALLTAYSEYRYDIQVKLSAGGISTPETGVIIAFPQITRSTS